MSRQSGNSATRDGNAFSRHLCFLLRHAAHEQGLRITTKGYALLSDILQLPSSARYAKTMTKERVEQLVAENGKQRFHCFRDAKDNLWIRANQGHSMSNIAVSMKKIDSAADYPVVLHGTYRKAYEKIKEKGLSRCTRQHIHFCTGKEAKSGMRADCTVLIRLDLAKALADGHEFFESSNGVILCAGDQNGFIPPAYFSSVSDCKTGQPL